MDLSTIAKLSKKKVPKSDWEWVSLPVDTGEKRTVCRYIYVHDGYAYGTNGKIIHKIKTKKESGYYSKQGQLLYSPKWYNYPSHIFELCSNDTLSYQNVNDDEMVIVSESKFKAFKIPYLKEWGFDVSLVKMAMSLPNSMYHIQVNKLSMNIYITLEGGACAVVMPMRLTAA